MSEGPLFAYRAMNRDGELHHDPVQALASGKLQSLWHALTHYKPDDLGNGLKVLGGNLLVQFHRIVERASQWRIFNYWHIMILGFSADGEGHMINTLGYANWSGHFAHIIF